MAINKLPPLTALKYFEVVARHQQLQSAADELCVTVSAVSRQIKQLEHFLGIDLFHRDRRSIELTDAGSAYADDLHGIFNQLFEATHRFQARSKQHTLHVRTSMMSFTQRWLMPRLFEFQAQYPQTEMQLTTCIQVQAIDFDRSQVDIGLTRERLTDDNLCCEPLIPELLIAVCAPSELANNAINTADDLAKQRLIVSTSREDTWDIYLSTIKANIPSSHRAEALQVAHFFFALEAAIAGLGVALLPLPLVVDDLKSGKLVAPLGQAVPSGETYYVVYRCDDQPANKEVGQFVVWLKEQAADTS